VREVVFCLVTLSCDERAAALWTFTPTGEAARDFRDMGDRPIRPLSKDKAFLAIPAGEASKKGWQGH